jgi:hypothetical protein
MELNNKFVCLPCSENRLQEQLNIDKLWLKNNKINEREREMIKQLELNLDNTNTNTKTESINNNVMPNFRPAPLDEKSYLDQMSEVTIKKRLKEKQK